MALPQEELYTMAEALAWGEQDHIELIYGVPYMQAAPSRLHQEISGELFGQLRDYLKGKKCKVYAAPFSVRLFERKHDRPEDVDTLLEPDISVICDPSKLDDIGCKGAPDLVMEILSPSTRRHDRLTKFNLYLRAGVREYWLVDPENRDAVSYVLEDGRYVAKNFGTPADKMKVEILEDCFIDLSQVFPE